MSLYAESSAVLAWLLGESPGAVVREALASAELVVASELTLVECDPSPVARPEGAPWRTWPCSASMTAFVPTPSSSGCESSRNGSAERSIVRHHHVAADELLRTRAATVAGAHCLVSGEDDLLLLGQQAGIEIARPRDFWDLEGELFFGRGRFGRTCAAPP